MGAPRDERTCQNCGHLRTEHKLQQPHESLPSWRGRLPEAPRGYCHACECPEFVPEREVA